VVKSVEHRGWRAGWACGTVFSCFLVFFSACGGRSGALFAQSATDNGDTMRGQVINSVTGEPIARALIYSPDNRFATMSNSEGRFAFTLPRARSAAESSSDAGGTVNGRMQSGAGAWNGPAALMARKPGFRSDPERQAQNLQNLAGQDVTLALTPESRIVGTVVLPSAEAPDSVVLQIFRRDVDNGRGHWVLAGSTQSKSDGGFRFADLPAGRYKLLTRELMERDPVVTDPRKTDVRVPQFGYPPVYYQNASDFGTAASIQLPAGQTETVSLTLAKQPYYGVKIPVIFPVAGGDVLKNGVMVTVYANGHNGPGFALGYDNAHNAIEGSLPNGTYTIEASSYGPTGVTGSQTITIKDGAIDGPSLTAVPKVAIPVSVKEEFTAANDNSARSGGFGSRTVAVTGPRRYLDVTLEPADDSEVGRYVSLPNFGGRPEDESLANALAIEGAAAGRYWVHVHSSRGYPASIRSGNLDLSHQPLVVGAAGAAAPIEITMRDDTAEISGTVEGVKASSQAIGIGDEAAAPSPNDQASAHIYCIPLPDSPGQFSEMGVEPDGSFTLPGLAPGAYRLLAFDREQHQLEYQDPEAMRAYDAKGPVVRVSGGQKERVTLQLISTGASTDEP